MTTLSKTNMNEDLKEAWNKFIYGYSKRKILDSSAFGRDSWQFIETAITKAYDRGYRARGREDKKRRIKRLRYYKKNYSSLTKK